MPKPVCVPCQRFYRPEKNGTTWQENKPTEDRFTSLPGTQAPNKWAPYKIWRSDLWKCHGCGHLLITGHAQEPLAQDYQTEQMAKWTPYVQFVVNDC